MYCTWHRRFLPPFLSRRTISAIGHGQKVTDTPFNESNWTNPDAKGVMPYAKSKTLAERAAWEFIAKEGGALELSVVNPVAVFGPVLGPVIPELGKKKNGTNEKSKRLLGWAPRPNEESILAAAESMVRLKLV
jgi:hypothetical protein